LACYRSFSQFKSQPRFWIDPTFEAQITEDRPINKGLLLVALTETFYHEYGHVICEFANLAASWVGVNTRELQKLIGSTQLNEEDFCEAFLRFLAKRPQPEDPKPWKFRRIISTYRRLAFLDQTKFK
jgi:hypothetical protein